MFKFPKTYLIIFFPSPPNIGWFNFHPLKKSKKIFLFLVSTLLLGQPHPAGAFVITRIHYEGGGDWYSDPSSIPNLLKFLSNHTSVMVNPLEKRTKIGEDAFLESSYLYLTGHGNINFSDADAQLLREQL